MFKKWIIAFALSLLSGSAYAACTNPLSIKDGGGSAISMSMSSNADGFCQYNFNMAQINGVAPLMGAGATGTGSPRVTAASDSPEVTVLGATGDAAATVGSAGSLAAKLRLMTSQLDSINTGVGAAVPAGTNLIGKVGIDQTTPGTTNGVQVNAALPTGTNTIGSVKQTDGTTVVVTDPCQGSAKTIVPITLATAAVKVIATGVSAKKIYVCAIDLTNNAADSVAVFEATTGTVCATAAVAVAGAGTSVATAATGYNFAANGGISKGQGGFSVWQTTVNNNDLCVAQSAATQLTGTIAYVTQ